MTMRYTQLGRLEDVGSSHAHRVMGSLLTLDCPKWITDKHICMRALSMWIYEQVISDGAEINSNNNCLGYLAEVDTRTVSLGSTPLVLHI